MILGLDASTSTVGWAFSNENVIVDAGFFDIKKFDTNKTKSKEFLSFIQAHQHYKLIENINLEAALNGFCAGRTSQQVIIKLSRFNAIFEYIIGESTGLTVSLINVNTARKKLFGKSREKGMKSKDFVQTRLEMLFDIHKFDVLNKKNNWDERNADMYDAMVMALT